MDLPLKCGSTTFTLPFATTSAITHECVIGSHNFKVFSINNEDQTITLDSQTINLVNGGSDCRLNTLEECVLPPNSSSHVLCSVPIQSEAGALITTGACTFLQEEDCYVPEMALEATTTINLLVVNPNPFQVCIPSDTPAATAVHLSDCGSRLEFNELVQLTEQEFDHEWMELQKQRELKFRPSKSKAYLDVKMGSELTDEQRSTLLNILAEHRSAFSCSTEDIGCIRNFKFAVRWRNEEEICYSKPIPTKPCMREKGDAVIKRWENMGIIKKKASPHNIPLFFVRKGLNGVRPVLDARRTNQLTIPTRWPLPSLPALLGKVSKQISESGGQVYFSVSDIASAFNQVRLVENDQKKIAFSWGNAQYQAQRMLFGCANSPAVFSEIVYRLFDDIEEVQVLIDDLLIVTATFKRHVEVLSEVLLRLRQIGATLKTEKTFCGVTEFQYLGFHINGSGITPIKSKIQGLRDFPVPRSRKQLRRFLGLLNFYLPHLKDAQWILAPLHRLTGVKRGPFQWTTEANTSFKAFKESLEELTALSHRDESFPLILCADASKTGLGASIHQKDSTGRLWPLGFWSRSLEPAETKLASRYLELLSIVCALEYFEDLTYGTPVYVISDHFSLTRVLQEKKMKRNLPLRIVNAFGRLSRFDVRGIEHRGNDSPIILCSDALSRSYEISKDEDIDPAESVLDKYQIDSVELRPQRSEAVLEINRYHLRSSGPPPSSDPVLSTTVPYSIDAVKRMQADDPELQRMKKEGHLEEDNSGILRTLRKNGSITLALPYQLHTEVLSFLHQKTGHPGTLRLMEIARRELLIRNLKQQAAEVSSSCHSCIRAKPRIKTPNFNPPKPEVSITPFEKVFVDLIDFGVTDDYNMRYCVCLMDDMTRFLCCRPVPSKEATEVTQALLEILLANNISHCQAVMDNGRELKNLMLLPTLMRFNIKVTFIAPYSPCGNKVERKFRDLSALARIMRLNPSHWSREIAWVIYHMNNHPTKALQGLSPSEALTGRRMILPIFNYNAPRGTPDPAEWHAYVTGWLHRLGSSLCRTMQGEHVHSEEPATQLINKDDLVAYWSPQRPGTSKKLHVGFEGTAIVIRHLQGGALEIEDTASKKRLIRNIRHLRKLPVKN